LFQWQIVYPTRYAKGEEEYIMKRYICMIVIMYEF
jgi:hypothetical protein